MCVSQNAERRIKDEDGRGKMENEDEGEDGG